MQGIKRKPRVLLIKAFTLLEALIVLAIISFLTLLFSFSLMKTVHLVRGELFLLRFENFYKAVQQEAGLSGKREQLSMRGNRLSGGSQELEVPEEIRISPFVLSFNEKGENSSLKKIEVFLPIEKKRVIYQLEMGSGKFKKKIS